MAKTFKPAVAVHPGELIRDELAARGITQTQFAKVIGRPVQVVNEIVNGKKRVTADTALLVAAAFGTSAELWVNLQTAYDLFHAKRPDPNIPKRMAELALA